LVVGHSAVNGDIFSDTLDIFYSANSVERYSADATMDLPGSITINGSFIPCLRTHFSQLPILILYNGHTLSVVILGIFYPKASSKVQLLNFYTQLFLYFAIKVSITLQLPQKEQARKFESLCGNEVQPPSHCSVSPLRLLFPLPHRFKGNTKF